MQDRKELMPRNPRHSSWWDGKSGAHGGHLLFGNSRFLDSAATIVPRGSLGAPVTTIEVERLDTKPLSERATIPSEHGHRCIGRIRFRARPTNAHRAGCLRSDPTH